MKKTLFLALITVCVLTATAAEIQTQRGFVNVTFLQADVVRVLKTTQSGHQVSPSLVATMTPKSVKVTRHETESTMTLTSSQLVVTVNRMTGRVTFANRRGQALLTEGDWQLTPLTTGLDRGCVTARANFCLESDEAIYGIGLMENGKMNQRGENRRMIQSNLEDFQNVFQSMKGYALYWDNYSPTQLTDTPSDGVTLTSEVADGIDYYFLYGQSADGNVALIRELTGDVPMLPLWGYGFWQSRERYKSRSELTHVVDQYRQLGIPLDGIILDWQYWDNNYLWNAMEFLNPEFKDPKGMIDYVHAQKCRFAISIWQSFGPYTKPYHDLKERGLLYDFETWPQSGLPQWPPRRDYPSGVRVYKPYTAEARDIYWKHLRRLYDLGVDMWWMDSTDPDHHSYQESDLDVPSGEWREVSGQRVESSYRKLRNAFPLECVRGVYEHQRHHQEQNASPASSKRVMVLTRSGFAGQQRYASNVWTGDVRSDWPTLRKQIPMMLNFSLTGNPHVNSDIGGFFSGDYNRTYGDRSSGARNPQFQELYVRWMQFGAFCPMMRSHGTETYRELYYFGHEGEPVYDALLDAIRLRYRLLPYTYSTAWDVTHRRGTFMRALWMDFARDAKTHSLNSEFLFGRQLLVAPIAHAQYTQEKVLKTDEMSGWNQQAGAGSESMRTVDFTKQHTYDVYLPVAKKWYDFWTGKCYDGGQQLTLTTTLRTIPLFARAGSIIPMGPEMQTTADRDWSALELRVYPGADGTFILYDDDGETYAYEQGQYTEIPLTWNDKRRTLTIGRRLGSYPTMLQSRRFTVVLPDGIAKTVNYQGKTVTVRF